MQNQEELLRLGSKTAKDGFRNETDVIDKFNNWQEDHTAQEWLVVMGYILEEIDYVKAFKIQGSYKADIQVSQGCLILKIKRF